MLAGDLRILKSERMDDTDDGGGPDSSQVVVNGQSNEIFPDISSVDTLRGELKIRKIYGHVNTQTVEPLMGSGMIISKIPGDTQITISMMKAGSADDRRPEAINQLTYSSSNFGLTTMSLDGYQTPTESQGNNSQFNQYVPIGHAECYVVQPNTETAPFVGQVLKLVDGSNEQQIRLSTVTLHSNEVSTDIYHVTFIASLGATFYNGSTEIYSTINDNLERPLSTKKLAVALTNGATTIQVDSNILQVIPQSVINDEDAAESVGIDPALVIDDGQYVAFDTGDILIVINDQETVNTFTSSAQTNLGRTNLSKVTVVDPGNNALDISKYTVDLDAGTIDWGDLTGVSQPLTVTDRIMNKTVVDSVSGTTITLASSWPITRDFPLSGTLVCNMLVFGDIWARTSVPFEQKVWDGTWSDELIGQGITAQYDNATSPITVDNASSIDERWRVERVSATHVDVVGERVGQILTNVDASVDIAPINPNTGFPYFLIPFGGWSSGWNAGELLRFNTYAPKPPVWINETIEQGPETDPDFSFCVEFMGDVNV